MSTLYQGSFSGGELDPSLHGRVDLDRYPLSLKTCRNYIVLPHGGLKNRGGTRYVAETKDSTKTSRLIPFVFSATESYVLEFGDYYMRVVKNGAQVMAGRVPVYYRDRVGIGRASGAASGDQFTLPYPGVSNVVKVFADVGSCIFSVAQVNGYTRITILSCTFPANQPLMWYGDYDGSATPYQITTPWSEAQVHEMQFCQSADVLFVTHPAVRPKRVERLNKNSVEWRIVDAPFKNGPWQDVNTDQAVHVFASGAVKGAVVTLESPDKAIFTSDNLGQLFYLEAQNFAKPWEQNKPATANLTYVRSDGKYYLARTTGTTGTLRPSHDSGTWDDGGVVWEYQHSGFGVVQLSSNAADILDSGRKMKGTVLSTLPITEVASTSAPGTVLTINSIRFDSEDMLLASTVPHGFGAVGVNVIVSWIISCNGITIANTSAAVVEDNATVRIANGMGLVMDIYRLLAMGQSYSATMVSTPAASGSGPGTNQWAFGAWSDHLGWPSCVGFYQQRLVFSSSPASPQTFWMSRTDSYDDFGVSNPIQADDSINFTIASAQLNKIENMISMSRLLMLSAGGVWLVTGGQEPILTPMNIGVELQGFDSASSLRPIGVGNSALFIQSKGQIVRDLVWELANEGYASNDVTVMSSHLLRGHTIKEWAFQQHPYRVVWMVRDDGVLLGMTYMREQRVVGWHRHDTDGLFESVACVVENAKDVVYVIVKRTIDGVTKRFVECFADRDSEEFFVDCGKTFTQAATYHTEPVQIVNEAYTSVGSIPQFYPADATNTTSLYLYSKTYVFTSADVGKVFSFRTADSEFYQLTITALINANMVRATTTKVLPNSMVAQHYTLGGGLPTDYLLPNPVTHWSFGSDALPVYGGGTVGISFDSTLIGPGLYRYDYYATFSTYVVTAADVGKTFAVMVNGSRYDYKLMSSGAAGTACVVSLVTAPGATAVPATLSWFMGGTTFSLPWLKGKGVWLVSQDSEATAVIDSVAGTTPAVDAPNVIVGLPYVSDFETLDVVVPQVNVRYRRKLTPNVKFLIDESRMLQVGSSFEQMFPTSINLTETYNVLTGRMTGVCEASITSTWGTKGRVCSRHSLPRPMSILAVMPEVENE